MREGVGKGNDQDTLKIHMKLSKNNKSIGTAIQDRLGAGNCYMRKLAICFLLATRLAYT